MKSGVINYYKDKGCTSHDAVNFIRRVCGGISRRREQKIKVGHAGTLDPLASGVLPIMIGSATKLSQLLTDHTKTYKAGLLLGISTDTHDTEGKVLNSCDIVPSADEVKAACESFKGEIMQIPPMYSAIKVGGKKLYELARNGVELELDARKIEIFSLEIQSTEDIRRYILTVECSKGTYIRSLCRDIGEVLGCGAVMSSLERVRCGNFYIESSVRRNEIETAEDVERFICPVEQAAAEFSVGDIYLDSFFYRLLRNGVSIEKNRITKVTETTLSCGDLVRMYDADGKFFALGKCFEKDNMIFIKCEIILEE